MVLKRIENVHQLRQLEKHSGFNKYHNFSCNIVQRWHHWWTKLRSRRAQKYRVINQSLKEIKFLSSMELKRNFLYVFMLHNLYNYIVVLSNQFNFYLKECLFELEKIKFTCIIQELLPSKGNSHAFIGILAFKPLFLFRWACCAQQVISLAHSVIQFVNISFIWWKFPFK